MAGCLQSFAKSLAGALRRTVSAAMEHDVLTQAQAVAYSAMFAVFPALIVVAAVVGRLPDTQPVRRQMALFFSHVLPPNVTPLLDTYFSVNKHNPHTEHALYASMLVALTGAAGVMATLMDGFRRAHGLPLPPRNFWPRRLRAVLLVPLSLVPMCVASALVMFGHVLTRWVVADVAAEMRPTVRVLSYLLRWGITLAGSTGIIAVVYHLGTDSTRQLRERLVPAARQPWQKFGRDWGWRASLPGAALATLLWFVSTLLFGFYVTRYANYSQVYGSLGAAIALMVWLYLIALSVLIGAEYNAQR